jgi:hypothetical protein
VASMDRVSCGDGGWGVGGPCGNMLVALAMKETHADSVQVRVFNVCTSCCEPGVVFVGLCGRGQDIQNDCMQACVCLCVWDGHRHHNTYLHHRHHGCCCCCSFSVCQGKETFVQQFMGDKDHGSICCRARGPASCGLFLE